MKKRNDLDMKLLGILSIGLLLLGIPGIISAVFHLNYMEIFTVIIKGILIITLWIAFLSHCRDLVRSIIEIKDKWIPSRMYIPVYFSVMTLLFVLAALITIGILCL